MTHRSTYYANTLWTEEEHQFTMIMLLLVMMQVDSNRLLIGLHSDSLMASECVDAMKQ